MTDENKSHMNNSETEEDREWFESLDELYRSGGPQRVRDILAKLENRAGNYGIYPVCSDTTPYINSIPADKQPAYPGNREIERRIKSIIRWNAMAMVVRANRADSSIGGHISTYASSATLYEVAFNHFFRGRTDKHDGDIVYFQGHAAPGIYARAFVEGRLDEENLKNFRREIVSQHGLSSYPHPWLMPEFWQFPTVSMGLGPIMSIYQARFNKYLVDRGLKLPSDSKVWAFLGDGELDEPESLGAITLASREKLDNLIFVVNCNLQRLDGPVRGNGKIIQELESIFRGAGWNVIKVIWGSDWDTLLAKDTDGLLVKRMGDCVDGQYQKYTVTGGDYIRKNFFGTDPRLLDMVKNYSDEKLQKLRRGGHDPEKVYAAYKAAVEHKGAPTVILAKTIKGYGLGEAGEGKNITHQQKKLNEQEMREFRSRFGIPISDKDVADTPFYRPPEDSSEHKYIRERRNALGGFVPERKVTVGPLKVKAGDLFDEYYEGTGEREVTTTMVLVHIMSKLLDDENVGKFIVPIVPDEARTFGMESLFRKIGIYASQGQKYEPVDRESLLYYREARDGVILEEGITEAGSMSSFIAAGTAYATHGINIIPFFIYYSMFGFQRIGDLIWAAGDMQAKGFLVGGTSGRTTLAGEGLQHQDGQSHLFTLALPNLKAYDPAFAYELAVIVKNGLHRMYENQENLFYYITVMNEFYRMPVMPEGVENGILRGMYRYRTTNGDSKGFMAHLMGSGAIMNEVIKAADILEKDYHIPAEIYSVTSYKELYSDAIDAERWNMRHPGETPRSAYVSECLKNAKGVCVAATDYVKAIPNSVGKWIPGRFIALGTDGYGRSDGRAALRSHFEVDAAHIVMAALYGLALDGFIDKDVAGKAAIDLKMDPDKINPLFA
jgi:pyruvate dehydrogenase E1 component